MNEKTEETGKRRKKKLWSMFCNNHWMNTQRVVKGKHHAFKNNNSTWKEYISGMLFEAKILHTIGFNVENFASL